MFDPGLITGAAGALLGAGGLSAIASYRKAGTEKQHTWAGTLIEVNDELRKELKRRDQEIDRLQAELSRLRNKFVELQSDFDALERELKASVDRRTNGS